jgi:hypothetical protein
MGPVKGVLGDGVRGPADDIEDLRRRRLLLQRFGQIGSALVQLVQQSRVLHEDGAFRSVAMHNVPQAFAEQRLSGRMRFAPKNPLGRLAVTKAVQHVVDGC